MNTNAQYDDTTTTISIDDLTRDVVVTTVGNTSGTVSIAIHVPYRRHRR
jgi:hypothetical protein